MLDNSKKIPFLKKSGVCFGCLCTGHISKKIRIHVKSMVSDIQVCSISLTRKRMRVNLILRWTSVLLQFRRVILLGPVSKTVSSLLYQDEVKEQGKHVKSAEDGPFAVKTVLGWTVNGPLGRKRCKRLGCSL